MAIARFSARQPHEAATVAVSQNNMSIPSLKSLLGHTAADLIETIIVSAKVQQSSAVTTAKCIIALVAVTGSETAARSELKKAKVSDCTVKNAMQLVWAYDAVVRPGHADEEWFDSLLYVHAVEVRRAIAKVGVAKLSEWKLFEKSAKSNLIEFELVADTGLSRAERVKAADDKAEGEIASAAAAKKKKDAQPVTQPAPEPIVEAPKPVAPPATAGAVASLETAKPGKGKVSALEQFNTLVGSVEKFVGAVFPTADEITIETMKNRVTSLMVLVDQAAKARAEALRQKVA